MQAITETLFDTVYLTAVITPPRHTHDSKKPEPQAVTPVRQYGRRARAWRFLSFFGFYIPVVLWADTIPLIGMLMIPKTCAYVWTVLIGYRAMRESKTPLQATGYQTCSAAEQRGI